MYIPLSWILLKNCYTDVKHFPFLRNTLHWVGYFPTFKELLLFTKFGHYVLAFQIYFAKTITKWNNLFKVKFSTLGIFKCNFTFSKHKKRFNLLFTQKGTSVNSFLKRKMGAFASTNSLANQPIRGLPLLGPDLTKQLYK